MPQNIILKKLAAKNGLKSYGLYGKALSPEIVAPINLKLAELQLTNGANRVQFRLDQCHYHAELNTKFQEHHEMEAVLAIKDMFEELGWLFTIHYPSQDASKLLGEESELFVFHNKDATGDEPLQICHGGKTVLLTVVNHKLDATGMYRDPFMFASGAHKLSKEPKPDTTSTSIREVYGVEVPPNRFPEPTEVKTTLKEVYGVEVPEGRFPETTKTTLLEAYGVGVPKGTFTVPREPKSKTPSTTLWEVYGGI